MPQAAFVVWYRSDSPGEHNVGHLNAMFADGWRFVSASPMSGTGQQGSDIGHGNPESRTLVILEREEPGPAYR